jgi:hypothetical protein
MGSGLHSHISPSKLLNVFVSTESDVLVTHYKFACESTHTQNRGRCLTVYILSVYIRASHMLVYYVSHAVVVFTYLHR